MAFLGIFHARQDNSESPDHLSPTQSNFKTTQSYAGDRTKQQNVSHWPQSGMDSTGLSCCGYWRKLGQPTQSPSSSRLLTALPRELEKPRWRDRDVTTRTTGQSQG